MGKNLFLNLLIFFIFISCGRKSEEVGDGSSIIVDFCKRTEEVGEVSNTDTTPPSVISTTPSDNATSVATSALQTIIIFSEEMEGQSMTTNVSDTSCSGTIQMSSDNFSSCVQMESHPTKNIGGEKWYVTTSSTLSKSTIYKIRITNDVMDKSGNKLVNCYTTPNGFTTVD